MNTQGGGPRPAAKQPKRDNYVLGMVVLIICAIVLGLLIPFIWPFNKVFTPSQPVSGTRSPTSVPVASPTPEAPATGQPQETLPPTSEEPAPLSEQPPPATSPAANLPDGLEQPPGTLPQDAWTKDGVKFRSAPSAPAAGQPDNAISTIPAGTKVSVTLWGEWATVVHNNQSGYIKAEFLTFTDPAANKRWVKCEGNLTLRASGDSSAAAIANMPNGTEVTVLEWPDSGDWAKVKFGTQEGWANKNYLSTTRP